MISETLYPVDIPVDVSDPVKHFKRQGGYVTCVAVLLAQWLFLLDILPPIHHYLFAVLHCFTKWSFDMNVHFLFYLEKVLTDILF